MLRIYAQVYLLKISIYNYKKTHILSQNLTK